MEGQQTRETDQNKDSVRRASEPAGMARQQPEAGTGDGAVEQAKTMARTVGEQARNIAGSAGSTAQDLARRAREQVNQVNTDALYEQGARAGEFLTRNVNEYPLAALLIAGMVGYGLGYLIHSNWSSAGWSDGERS